MYASRFQKRKAKARRPARRPVRRAVKPSKALTKIVQKIIHRDAETKSAYHAIDSVLFNSAMNTTGDIQRVLPNVVVGTAENQRIGEQIRAQTLKIKGYFILSTANNSTANARIAVRMMVVQPKNLSAYPDVSVSTAWMQQLLQKGGGNVAFTGLISDLYAPVNTDQITCYYDKVSYVSMPYLYTATLGVPTSGYAVTQWDLSKATKFFNISLKVKNKLLRYDKSYDGNQPTSYSPILLIGYSHLDGSAPDVITTQVALSYDSVLQYEDM